MLHQLLYTIIQLLERAGLHTHLDAPVERAGAFALGMVLLDVIISHGPQKGLLLRLFRQGPPGTKEARRFLSQLAAKLVGMVFLSAIFPLAFAVLLGEPALRAAPFVGTSPTSQRMVEVASGYFLYDIVLCMLKYSDNGFEFLLHAVVCSCVYTIAAMRGVMHYYGAAFLMWELSTPAMYTRWLMLKAGLGSSAAMPLVNAAFMLAFFGCRVVWGPIMTVEFWRDSAGQLLAASPALPPAAIWVVRVMSIALNLLNYYWFATMVKLAVKGKTKTKVV
ncbi:hypothetical protein CHLNCDRAFT_53483 [Chlorella variabilis]|uniref:TLC domain-containing protein n=1 Tax=Chlorella variabilis TaxID=554065 RepID=E1ZJA6_CHLVA|nr:hypothetical protein CHLNCDRAFT_53483 [Chlorella variabilis]EFN53962.1 hypothetical protein CHLNCDRAFT_53483 [Chlorella variabilis]|eukprot:XP_005846064.1 hypothetical protein CHLNCDRAFT_53483 [Chlorella variabilis]